MLRFALIFLTSVLISISYGATLYVNSTFLGQFFSTASVSGLYIMAAIGNITLFFTAPLLLRRFRKGTLLTAFLLLTGLGSLGLAMATSPLMAASAFILGGSTLFMGYYFLDISLEELSSNQHTGAIRGLYWTFLNGGITLGPLLVALIIKGDAVRPIYFASAFLLLGAIVSTLFMHSQSSQSVHHKYHQPLKLPFRLWWRRRNVRAVTMARFVLEAFFSLMTIFTPIYLHEYLGFSWAELGIIFTIMLLPFVLLEWPAGEVADRWWGEKEIMTIGFFLTGSMLLLMPFLGDSFSYWLVVLLISRVGASLVEITTESYFFKKISAEDTSMLSIFRLTRPASIIFAAIMGTLSLNFLSFEKIFFVIAVVVFFGMKESLHLRDTK